MTEPEDKPSDAPASVTLGMLEALELGKLLADVTAADERALQKTLSGAAEEADGFGETARAEAFRLLADLASIALRVEDRAEPFGPMIQIEGRRSSTASDFRGEQNLVIAAFAGSIANPVLRARLADVAWYNDRTKGDAGKLAVAAYCDVVAQRLGGALHHAHGDDDRLFDCVAYVTRALQLGARLYKAGELPDVVTQTLRTVLEKAVAAGEYVAFCSLAQAGLS